MNVWAQSFLPALLRYNLHITLFKLKVYHGLIWYTDILQTISTIILLNWILKNEGKFSRQNERSREGARSQIPKKKKKWLSEIILSSVSRMGWKGEIRCEETKWKPRAVDEEDFRWRGFKTHWAIILAVFLTLSCTRWYHVRLVSVTALPGERMCVPPH